MGVTIALLLYSLLFFPSLCTMERRELVQAPSILPSASPTTRITSTPTQPTRHPTLSQPSGQPSSQPSSQPTGSYAPKGSVEKDVCWGVFKSTYKDHTSNGRRRLLDASESADSHFIDELKLKGNLDCCMIYGIILEPYSWLVVSAMLTTLLQVLFDFVGILLWYNYHYLFRYKLLGIVPDDIVKKAMQVRLEEEKRVRQEEEDRMKKEREALLNPKQTEQQEEPESMKTTVRNFVRRRASAIIDPLSIVRDRKITGRARKGAENTDDRRPSIVGKESADVEMSVAGSDSNVMNPMLSDAQAAAVIKRHSQTEIEAHAPTATPRASSSANVKGLKIETTPNEVQDAIIHLLFHPSSFSDLTDGLFSLMQFVFAMYTLVEAFKEMDHSESGWDQYTNTYGLLINSSFFDYLVNVYWFFYPVKSFGGEMALDEIKDSQPAKETIKEMREDAAAEEKFKPYVVGDGEGFKRVIHRKSEEILMRFMAITGVIIGVFIIPILYTHYTPMFFMYFWAYMFLIILFYCGAMILSCLQFVIGLLLTVFLGGPMLLVLMLVGVPVWREAFQEDLKEKLGEYAAVFVMYSLLRFFLTAMFSSSFNYGALVYSVPHITPVSYMQVLSTEWNFHTQTKCFFEDELSLGTRGFLVFYSFL